VKQREKNRSAEETDIKKGRPRTDLKNIKKWIKINCLRFIFLVAGHGESHCRQEGEEEKKLSQIHMFTCSACSRAWRRRAATIQVVQKAFPVIPDCFRAIFCNFWFV
jgi:hypothetical protein